MEGKNNYNRGGTGNSVRGRGRGRDGGGRGGGRGWGTSQSGGQQGVNRTGGQTGQGGGSYTPQQQTGVQGVGPTRWESSEVHGSGGYGRGGGGGGGGGVVWSGIPGLHTQAPQSPTQSVPGTGVVWSGRPGLHTQAPQSPTQSVPGTGVAWSGRPGLHTQAPQSPTQSVPGTGVVWSGRPGLHTQAPQSPTQAVPGTGVAWSGKPGLHTQAPQSQTQALPGMGPAMGESSEVYGSGGNGRGGGARSGSPGLHSQAPQSQSQALPDIESLQISERKPPVSLSGSTENRIVPIKRPDIGGTAAVRKVGLLANHFSVRFNPEGTILHYDVHIKPQMSPRQPSRRNFIPKVGLRRILTKLFSDDPTRFPDQMTAYDGMRNIFSNVQLPTGQFGGEDMEITIALVNKLSYSKIDDYISGNHPDNPRDILQGMDLVMKENPSSQRIPVYGSFYSKQFREEDDLQCGVAAFRGFQQSLKPTSQGLALCLDHSVLAFCKQMPVIDFLMEHVRGFQDVNDVWKLRRDVLKALKGLKVYVTHRDTKQRFTVAGLSIQSARNTSFPLVDREGREPPREIGVVEYFWETYNKEILYYDIPCLDLGKANMSNYVPMEFCTLVEGQMYPKEKLHKERGSFLKRISMPQPKERKSIICEMVRAKDGPCGNVVRNFKISVDNNMTRVMGRVLAPPDLKLRGHNGKPKVIRVDREKCQWNLYESLLVEGKPLKRWALIDFSLFDRFRLNSGLFIQKLRKKCSGLGIPVEEPVVCRFTGMRDLSSVATTQELLDSVVKEANGKCNGRLQLFLCVMSEKHEAKKYLKWVSETRIGIMTQCCLVSLADKRDNEQYLSNLALKINAKLGGSNVELVERLPGFPGEEHVMFIGADVNHPKPGNATCPSIAAVVATTNWPAVSRCVARICPQEHRVEKIVNFGPICLDLVNTYARLNKIKPKKIVVFRDGVSEGQFDMVLNEELQDMKRAIYDEDYTPTITLIVAQKRHLTRIFVENERDGGKSGNVPPGTVVDTKIVHPSHFDFYLNSHYGIIGTSKAAHYYVLLDEHNFTSDQIQKLVYHLCFTSARCTKPVSLVPPVFYADLVAYRGRLYQEVAMELQPSSAVSLSSAVSSSSAALLSEGLYKVHPALENEMFFV